jgi:hypothetical protein
MYRDIGRLAADELAMIDRHYRALERLGDDPVFVMLRDAELTGVTRQRWDAASAAVLAATSRLGKWRETVADVIRLVRADPPDPERAERLLLGRSVPLTPAETPKEDRRPPASSSSELRFSMQAVKDFVAHDLGTAQRVVENVAAIQASARPRLDQLTTRLDDAEARLGPAAGNGDLGALRRGLDDAWRLLAADPLALGPMAAPGPGPLDALDAGLARLAPDGDTPPAADPGRLARLRAEAGELAALESRVRARRDELATKYGVVDVPPGPAAAAGLAARLDAARLDDLDDLDAIGRAVTAATQAAERADETFSEWCLLWARLETYRLRASRRGRATRPELTALYARARQLLEKTPCDLRRAGQAVRAYMSMERADDPGPGMP